MATREDSQLTQSWQESLDAKADSSPNADLQRKRIKHDDREKSEKAEPRSENRSNQ